MYIETFSIETERLILRPPVLEHFEGLVRLLADPGVAKSLSASGRPRNRFESWQSFAGQVGHWQLRGFGMFNVFERGTGEFVGRVGPWHPEGWPGFEVGWSLISAYWGRGYATEAALASIDFAFTDLDQEQVMSLISPANTASVAVALRCGERRMGETSVPHMEGLTVDVYGVTREEWERRREKS
jgi:RimJ/RimL family protein N-acetyltransferase